MKRHFHSIFLWVFLLAAVLTAGQAQAQDSALEKLLIESCTTGQEADLSQLQITADTLQKVHLQLYREGRYPWYAQSSCSYYESEQSGLVVSFVPNLLPEDTYSRTLYQQRAAEILDETVKEGMSSQQIALSIHDYLAAHIAYDTTLTRYESYDALIHGSAVCSGYARAYMELLHMAGIPCIVVETDDTDPTEGHAWNLVNLDGNWYHVDVTWDDPAPNVEGRVEHTYFLSSDSEILSGEKPHAPWNSDAPPAGSAPADSFWRDIHSPICYDDSLTCYYRINADWSFQILARSPEGQTCLLHTEDPAYVDVGQGPRSYDHCSLSLWNGRLYFNSMEALYSIAPDGSDLREEARPDLSGKFLLGAYVYRDQARLTLASGDMAYSDQSVTLAPTGYHVHSYVPTVVPPTCEAGGYTQYTCICGITYQGDPAAPLGHSYSQELISQAGYRKPGIRRFTCRQCGHTYDEEIPALTLPQLLQQEPLLLAVFVGIPLLAFTLTAVLRRKK